MTSVKIISVADDCHAAVECLFAEEEIAVDIEGVSLSREGEICLIQIYAPKSDTTYLFDIHVLGQSAFDEGGLKKLFEDDKITKIFFDLRADNDALHHLHGVKVKAIYDVQVLHEILFSFSADPKLTGLKTAMSNYFEESKVLSEDAKNDLEVLKNKVRALFAPELGGSYEVWKQRPMTQDIINYAAADVEYLAKMKDFWTSGINREELDAFVRQDTRR
jgi:exonuclease 3'-5' domain-containing protein 1